MVTARRTFDIAHARAASTYGRTEGRRDPQGPRRIGESRTVALYVGHGGVRRVALIGRWAALPFDGAGGRRYRHSARSMNGSARGPGWAGRCSVRSGRDAGLARPRSPPARSGSRPARTRRPLELITRSVSRVGERLPTQQTRCGRFPRTPFVILHERTPTSA